MFAASSQNVRQNICMHMKGSYLESIKSSQLLSEEETHPKLSSSLTLKKIFTWTKQTNKQQKPKQTKTKQMKKTQQQHKIPVLPTGPAH